MRNPPKQGSMPEKRRFHGMFILGNFLKAIATVLDIVLTAYMWLIIARAILSWVSPDPSNPIVRFINNVTEPVLGQIRKRVPVVFSGIDLSPILLILVIIFLQAFLVANLFGLANKMM